MKAPQQRAFVERPHHEDRRSRVVGRGQQALLGLAIGALYGSCTKSTASLRRIFSISGNALWA